MLTAICLAVAFCWLWFKASKIGKRPKGFPPGPPTIPLLGNLHLFPKEYAHHQLTAWSREFGDIYSLMLGPVVAVVISSAAASRELLDRRSASTVDRPPHFMAHEITGGLNLVLARYSEQWRLIRKAAHSMLTPQASDKYIPIQKAESVQLMYDILNKPERTWWHIRRYSSSVILSVLYGKRAPRYETKETMDFFHVQHLWEHVLEPGAHPPIDILPFLRYTPERWAPWKSLCREVRRLQRELYFGLLEECEQRVADGSADGQESFMDEVVRHRDDLGLTQEMAGYLGGVLVEGGSDTTSSFIQSLVLALGTFPEVQRQAQEEVDRIVGTRRMPTPEDYDRMPYVQALIKETHRFRPVAPLAIPHGCLVDETYRGYLIPRGCTIFYNIWGILHDPEIFDAPETFNPERYLRSEFGTKQGIDDTDFRHTLPFGAGRRICPGIHLANNSLIINAMNLVWGFNFKPLQEATKDPFDTYAYEKASGPWNADYMLNPLLREF
ncbi:cytochrome P450 [Punctularia strigosozonata HHB-11173 SS5]|uniref:cytochrome P450 n=1 Tax=Punctularia strigosozonata (strain HHB-11173) TaxID=741275 RepID=UPI0004417653|nr:cytochrome P450 [Punctularia strigosozonata HHB-11173 SS5]EIN10089.1 cytochrome P450 [Punctularia strigosozonata HHB-11173 SS5]